MDIIILITIFTNNYKCKILIMEIKIKYYILIKMLKYNKKILNKIKINHKIILIQILKYNKIKI